MGYSMPKFEPLSNDYDYEYFLLLIPEQVGIYKTKNQILEPITWSCLWITQSSDRNNRLLHFYDWRLAVLKITDEKWKLYI